MQYRDTAIVTIDVAPELLGPDPTPVIDLVKSHAIALSGLADRREPPAPRFGPRPWPEMGGWVKAAIMHVEISGRLDNLRYTIYVEGWRTEPDWDC